MNINEPQQAPDSLVTLQTPRWLVDVNEIVEPICWLETRHALVCCAGATGVSLATAGAI